MKSLKLVLSIILSIIIVSSCTVEKRHHETGYHIEWKKNSKIVENKSFSKSQTELINTSQKINKSEYENKNLVIETKKVSPNFGKAKNEELTLVLKESVLDNLYEKKLKNIESDQSQIPKSIKSYKKKAKKEDDGEKMNGFAIAGFVLSILGILFFPLLILGVVFSAIALGQIEKKGGKGRGLANAGLIISIVFLSIYFLIILILLAAG